MTVPKRGLTITPLDFGGRLLPPDTPVWILAAEGGQVTVEHGGRAAGVPRAAIVESPVPRPSLDGLRALDPCFGLDAGSFEDVFASPRSDFRIVRCRAHGRHFLDDVRGGVGMYETLTLLEPGEETTPEATWDRYHAMSTDWLHLMGRSL